MDKSFLLQQLGAKLRAAVETTHAASSEARQDARSGAARAVNMAKAQGLRSTAAREALDALDQFRVRPLGQRDPIQLGAVVEVEGELGGRTLFIAPVCGGEELTGPDGDGIFQVVTPASPFGRALMGKRMGAEIEVMMGGEPVDWTVTYVA
jgi:transcription elongation GreA/GreB family factor